MEEKRLKIEKIEKTKKDAKGFFKTAVIAGAIGTILILVNKSNDKWLEFFQYFVGFSGLTSAVLYGISSLICLLYYKKQNNILKKENIKSKKLCN